VSLALASDPPQKYANVAMPPRPPITSRSTAATPHPISRPDGRPPRFSAGGGGGRNVPSGGGGGKGGGAASIGMARGLFLGGGGDGGWRLGRRHGCCLKYVGRTGFDGGQVTPSFGHRGRAQKFDQCPGERLHRRIALRWRLGHRLAADDVQHWIQTGSQR